MARRPKGNDGTSSSTHYRFPKLHIRETAAERGNRMINLDIYNPAKVRAIVEAKDARIAELAKEVARLNAALQWEQNRSGRVGTHGPDCHTWGPAHYECLLRRTELQAHIAAVPEPVVEDLRLLVGRLVHALRKAAPGNDLADKAMDYLQRKGLQGSPLRAAAPSPNPAQDQLKKATE